MLWGMLVLAVLCAFTAVIAKAAAEGQRWQRRFLDAWAEGARTAGLNPHAPSQHERWASGVVEGVTTRAKLGLQHAGEHQTYQCTAWASSAYIPPNLSLRRDSALLSMSRWAGGGDVPIGDPGFDDRVELPVVDAHVCAALSFEARRQLTRLLDWGVQVQGGNVVSTTHWSTRHMPLLPALLRSVALAARLLSVAPGELPLRLARNALHDPAPDVRLRNLRFLVAPETGAPPELITSTVLSLLGDEALPVRLFAAEHAGAEGHALLREVAADASVELEHRMQAVKGLTRPPAPDLPALRALLTGGGEPMLAHAALTHLDASTGAALLDAVLSHAASEHEAVRAGAARVLGVVARPETEATLVRLLSDASPDVQQASAEALGAFGSVAAVEPLLPLAQSLVRPRLRQAARGAIGRIQSRLGDVEAGLLSLSDPHDLAGAVDVADGSAAVRVGALSLVEDPGVAGATPAVRVEEGSESLEPHANGGATPQPWNADRSRD